MVTCQGCGTVFWPGCFNGRDRYDGKVTRFCATCRPAVKRVRMRLVRAGHRVTWTAAQVAQVRRELREA
ncbi:MAG: hypothetical protein ACREKK_00410 [Candidatus Methylomirabilales bacterium]